MREHVEAIREDVEHLRQDTTAATHDAVQAISETAKHSAGAVDPTVEGVNEKSFRARRQPIALSASVYRIVGITLGGMATLLERLTLTLWQALAPGWSAEHVPSLAAPLRSGFTS